MLHPVLYVLMSKRLQNIANSQSSVSQSTILLESKAFVPASQGQLISYRNISSYLYVFNTIPSPTHILFHYLLKSSLAVLS